MLLRTGVSVLVIVGCSAGKLDLDGKDRQKEDGLWPQTSTALSEQSLIDMRDQAENGVALFASGFNVAGEHTYTDPDAGRDQVLLPSTFERPIFRRALATGTVVTSGNREHKYDCWASTTGALVEETACADSVVCGMVVTQVVERCGPGPCDRADGSYNLRINSAADTLQISFSERPNVIDLKRLTAAFDGGWVPSSLQDAPAALVDPSAYVFGDKILVFGRSINGGFDGGFFDPGLNKWTPIKREEMPAGGGPFRGVWTGDKLLLFLASGGAVFDAGANAWRGMKAEGAPALDGQPFAAAYDAESKRAFVYGNGQGGGGTRFSIGAIYDVDANAWTSLPVEGGPVAEAYSGGAWTGNELVVWSEVKAGRAVFFPQSGQWAAFKDVAGFDVSDTTGSSPSRVFNFDGRVLIVPSGITFSPNEDSKWAHLDAPAWFDRDVAIQFDKSATILLSSKSQATSSQLLGIDVTNGLTGFPRTPSAPASRDGSAVAKLGNYLFVYGGCDKKVNDRCQVFTRAGAVVKLRPYGAK